jgi:cobaltochelatase CobN
MKSKNKKRILLFSVLSIVIIGTGIWFWNNKISPTRVALISFPEYRIGQFLKAGNNKWIKIVPMEAGEMKRLSSFDFILVFPYGLRLSPEQKFQLSEAGEKGAYIFRIFRSGSINNLPPNHLDAISAYLKNQCPQNNARFLNYIRREIEGKTFFSQPVEPAKEMSVNSFFYKDDNAIFPDLASFKDYCKKHNIHKDDAKKLIIFAGMPGPFDAGREQYVKIIEAFGEKGYNIFPVSGYEKRKEYLEQIQPDAVLYFPVGKFLSVNHAETARFLQQQDIPVFCPLGLYSPHKDWIKNRGRMNIVMSSQRVVSPELDGGIIPYAMCAQYLDNDGYIVFDAIEERLENYVCLVDNYVKLKNKKNNEKRVAIVYYKAPGKNAMGGAGIEGIPSLHNTLLKLRDEGYNLKGLPGDYNQFRDLLNRKGNTFGAYAKGAIDEYIRKGHAQLIPVHEYTEWSREILEEEMLQAVYDTYGNPKDSYRVSHSDSLFYMAISRIRFGNVVILPQPMAGYGNNMFKITHGTEMPPPHDYLAPYFWLQKSFRADAVIHFGTHGSLEFLHGKQIALSPYDWPDPVIGNMPHFYFYNISAVGEGIIAKRRSYATLLSHLTPPFMESDALKENELHTKLSKYNRTEGALKEQYALSIKKIIIKEGIHIDLGLDDSISKAYNEDEMQEIENYLVEIGREKVTGNQYVFGRAYTQDELNETTRLIAINPLSYNLAKIDILKGIISNKEIENSAFFNSQYVDRCNKAIIKVLNGLSGIEEFNKIVDVTDQLKAEKWRARSNEQVSNEDLMHMMMQMAGDNKKEKGQINMSKHTRKHENEAGQNLRELIVKVSAHPEQKDFLLQLQSKEKFERAKALLDPSKKASLKKMARMIPAMKKSLEIASDSIVGQVLKLMQDSTTRFMVFSLLKDKSLKSKIKKQKRRNDSLLVKKALAMPFISVTSLTGEKINHSGYDTLSHYSNFLSFYEDNAEKIKSIIKKANNNTTDRLLTFLNNRLEDVSDKVHLQKQKIANNETEFANAVFNVKQTLLSISDIREQLKICPESEFEAMVKALNGGYIPSSPGGDPVTTPETFPTGKNMYSINVRATPSKEAWEVGKRLGDAMLNDYLRKHGTYPGKVNFTLWSGSFIESEGTTIAEILYLLGARPVWGKTGTVSDVVLVSPDELAHPRIDVMVQTSGQFRDLGGSRLFLIQKAIEMAAVVKEDHKNFVSAGTREAEKYLIDKGYSPKEARKLSTSRIFGGVNNNYGTGIMGMVESSDLWDSTSSIAKTYINNMGAVYGNKETWADFREGVFEAALLQTDAVVQPRQSNTWGPLSLDHVYEFMGGINLAVKEITGKDAESYFNDYRNASYARVQNLQQAIWAEARTTMLNPKYIKEKMKGEASAAEDFAEVFRNTFGWNVMKPTAIDDQLWGKYYDVYVKDKGKTGISDFFRNKNPYAYQEITAIMLETIRKKMWDATPGQLKTLANLHTELVNKYDGGCSGFVCDNTKLQHFIENQIENIVQREKYAEQVTKIREITDNTNNESVVLRKKRQENLFDNLEIDRYWIFIGIGLVLFLMIVFIKRRRR